MTRPIEQTLDRVESVIRQRGHTTGVEICAELGIQMVTLNRYTRALQLDDRIHRVKPIGGQAGAGGMWAAGPALDDINDEPIHLRVKHWIRGAGSARISMMEACLFGRAVALELRA
ncbi:MAG: hypothetical protein V4724_26785 [Pseudomonadota bacterium]